MSYTECGPLKKKKKLAIPQVFHTRHFLVGSHNTPSLWAGTNGGCVFAYMLRLPSVEHRADEPVTAQPGEKTHFFTG